MTIKCEDFKELSLIFFLNSFQSLLYEIIAGLRTVGTDTASTSSAPHRPLNGKSLQSVNWYKLCLSSKIWLDLFVHH